MRLHQFADFIRKINKDILYSLLVTFSLFLSGFFAYILHFLLGRSLTVAGYGDFNALLSLLTVLFFVVNVFGLALVKIYSELFAQHNITALKYLFKKSMLLSAGFGVISALLIITFAPWLESLLKIDNSYLLIFFALSICLNITVTFFTVFFQGTLAFIYYSIYIIQGGLTRLLFPLVFVFFISKTPDMVYLGFVFSNIISIIFGLVFYKLSLNKVHANEYEGITSPSGLLYRKVLKETVPIGIITGTLTLMANMDLIFVKSHFNPYYAGIFAGTVTLGKIILFGSGSISTVMYPRVVSIKNDTKKLIHMLKMFFGLQIAFLLVPLIVYLLWPKELTLLLFGIKYIESVPYLPLYALFISLWVLTNFLLTVFIALDYKKVAYILPIFCLLQVLLLSVFNNTLREILLANLISVSILFLSIASIFYYKMKTFQA